jgi:hypothetical protein
MTATRPRSESRQRKKIVGVRVSPAELSLLEAEADRTGKSEAALLRDAFLATLPGGSVITRPELQRAIVRLAEITGNRDNYYPALADDMFRYAKNQPGETGEQVAER